MNHMYNNAYIKGRAVKVLSKKAKEWVELNSIKIKNWVNENDWSAVDGKLIIYLWFYYGDKRRRDCHNMFKILFDQLEQDGIVIDDKFILPRVVDFLVDKDNPRVELKFKIKKV